MKRDTNILRYQASKEYEFPIIARIARDHLAILATLAASKSVFSVGGDIITKKMNRLSAGNTRRLLCLRDWGVLEEGVNDGSDNEIDPDEIDSWEQHHFYYYIYRHVISRIVFEQSAKSPIKILF